MRLARRSRRAAMTAAAVAVVAAGPAAGGAQAVDQFYCSAAEYVSYNANGTPRAFGLQANPQYSPCVTDSASRGAGVSLNGLLRIIIRGNAGYYAQTFFTGAPPRQRAAAELRAPGRFAFASWEGCSGASSQTFTSGRVGTLVVDGRQIDVGEEQLTLTRRDGVRIKTNEEIRTAGYIERRAVQYFRPGQTRPFLIEGEAISGCNVVGGGGGGG